MEPIDHDESLQLKAKRIFLAAIESETPEEVEDVIRVECIDDPLLAKEVRKLLDAHQSPNQILNLAECLPAELPRQSHSVAPRITNYEVGDLIGEGGMGLVYRAIQIRPVTRTVAIKILKPGLDSQEVLARFQIEQEALARMNHIGIAKVSDAGQTQDGYPFFAMELVEGLPITDHCNRERLNPNDRLRLFLDVCSAVSHAHQKGIIHRDLKPTNILIAQLGDSPVPKVIDFGLARAIESPLSAETRITKTHRIIGTPRYMSPEQSTTNGEDVDTRSDIYSLGTILYELLTNLSPRQGVSGVNAANVFSAMKPSSAFSTINDDQAKALVNQQGCSKSQLESMLRRDLDWIILKSLEEEPKRRYESVAAFAHDIRRFLNDEPIEARPPSLLYRTSKFAKRHRAGMLAAITAVASLLLFAILMWRQSIESRRHTARTNTLLAEVRKQKDRAQVAMYAADVRIAAESLAEGDIVQALALLQRQQPSPDSIEDVNNDHRGIEWSHLLRQATASRTQYPLSKQSLRAIALGLDNTLIATAGDDSAIRFLDVNSGKITAALNTDHHTITTLALSPDAMTLASGGTEGMIHLWRFDSGESIGNIQFGPEEVLDLQFSEDGSRLFASGRTSEVRVFDISEAQLSDTYRFHEKTNESIALSADGNLLGCVSDDKQVSLWDWGGGKVVHHAKPTNFRLTRIAFSPDGEFVVFASVKGDIEVRSISTWRPTFRATVPSAVQSLAVSPDSRVIAVGCRSGIIHLLTPDQNAASVQKDAGFARIPQAIFAHNGRVNDLAWIDNHRLSSAGGDGAIVLSRLDVELTETVDNTFESNVICVSSDGRWIGTHDYQTVRLIDTSNGQVQVVSSLKAETHFAGMTFSNDNSTLFLATAGGKLLICPIVATSTVKERQLPLNADYASLRFSADGSRLMLLSRADDIAVVADMPELDIIFQIPCPDAYTGTLSPDGKYLATSYQGDVLVYSVDTGELIKQSLAHHNETINDLKFGPDGTWIVTSSDDRTIRIWHPWKDDAGEVVGVFPNGVPRGLAFSRDGNTLFSNSRSGEVWVFSISTKQKLFPIMRSTAGFRESLLSTDDSTLVTLDEQSEIRWLRL